jgi:hypothetical protein
VTGWQPIETAPRDGTEILFWVAPEMSEGWAEVGHWFETAHDGWWVAHTIERKPTHWMPLPEPPK